MNPKINKQDIEFLIDCLQNGKEIPEVYKYAIFPTKQKEYELVYAGKMRKEDVLADTEEAKPVPLQIEKVFNGKKYPLYSKDWHNLLVFGDNLQILKTFNDNKDPLIKGKVKGRVKLIYIDPPFATTQEFSKKAFRSYTDDKRAAEFVEYLRRRLIIAKEILSDDGSILIHLDWRKAHYLKLVLDEIFGENNFRNEIVWKKYSGIKNQASKKLTTQTDSIFWYSKKDEVVLNPQYRQMSKEYIDAEYKYMDKNGRKYAKLRGRGYQESGGETKIKYLDENPGSPITSLWDDDGLQLNTSLSSTPFLDRLSLFYHLYNF